MDKDELEEMKKKKLKEKLQQSGGMEDAQAQQEMQREQVRKQIKKIASKILTKEARSRLGNLRAAKPEMASQIEAQLVQLHKMGQIKDKITDEQLKQLLKKIQSSDEDRDIKFR
jgi:programmed cell death protein 5